ncbi:hypothetical protein MVEN_00912400 [Mycena venus]|uniref:Uncharacterized protein n=1 Tax=Mycena venus TaxID=2733690 RepID=A0A8H7D1P4_9AGAR|nr:hypothetical protein MVEN_00912400 [Mycena venus]
MWAKLTQTFKLRQVHDDRGTNSHGEVLADDPEQYPIPAVVHRVPASLGPPRSFSTRPTVLKRHAKDNDEPKEPKRAPSLMKRVASSFGTQKHVASQVLVGQSLADAERGPTSSHNRPNPPASETQPKHHSSFNVSKRSSLVGPRSPTTTEHIRSPPRIDEPRVSGHDRTTDPATPFLAKSGSVHFVPHHDHTPGTDQNGRYAYDQSVMTHPRTQQYTSAGQRNVLVESGTSQTLGLYGQSHVDTYETLVHEAGSDCL